MIHSFRHKGLQRLFEHGDRKGVRADQAERVENKLALLNRARRLDDIRLPGLRLHPLKGDRRGEFSVAVNANWRLTFRFEDGGFCDLNLEDYH